jgi:hypothetical protein
MNGHVSVLLPMWLGVAATAERLLCDFLQLPAKADLKLFACISHLGGMSGKLVTE